jgi:hypothetical protein
MSNALTEFFQDLGRIIAIEAAMADEEWCGLITLSRDSFHKPIKGLDCILGICRVTKPHEVVRIDFNIDNFDPLQPAPFKDMLLLLIRLAVEPHFVGFGEVVIQETPEGAVIQFANKGKLKNWHGHTSAVERQLIMPLTPAKKYLT